MNQEYVLGLAREALITVLMVGGPVLALSLLAGLAVSVFQATTQINEQTLVFVPKIIAVLLAVVFFGPWMITTLVTFTVRLWQGIPGLIG
ncbi:MAG: flagellar biosynthesis protein FliQ [Firmicutes bacterium]|nr:flagellar biosynthesis protein FliQ [Bacillota bacterium]